MTSINIKKELLGSLDHAIEQLTAELKLEGFGILTRIDLHTKVKEKLNEELRPVVILGACNPQLAFEAYSYNSDVASVLPCNAVLRDIGNNRISVELARPSSLMKFFDDKKLELMALDADARLESALNRLGQPSIAEWSPAELAAQKNSCDLIDVRGQDEFDGPLSHIVGSKLITLGPELAKYLEMASKAVQERTMVFICRSGSRSMKAAHQARELGLFKVINLKGGMIEWNEANLPTYQNTAKGLKI
jgi:uncharacterized protein (DUF302 family)/rhodanese-related sulfurtransferase